ncbi:MAG: precorrin-6Y C5,15-methyltransferase (decarboxylating) subunit CbiT [Thermoplasmatales archaeon]
MEQKKWEFDVPGIPDELFERNEGIPMTKEEIRALSMSKLRLKNGDRAIDIGCGTGSVSVEISNIVGNNGHVIAIDKDENAITLTKRNCDALCRNDNVTIVRKDAKNIDEVQYSPTSIFVGGGSGELQRIMEWGIARSERAFNIVLNAIQIETAYSCIRTFQKFGLQDISIINVSISQGMKTSLGHAMIARNPIYVISGRWDDGA